MGATARLALDEFQGHHDGRLGAWTLDHQRSGPILEANGLIEVIEAMYRLAVGEQDHILRAETSASGGGIGVYEGDENPSLQGGLVGGRLVFIPLPELGTQSARRRVGRVPRPASLQW